MTDSLTIWGTDYTGVTGFKAGAQIDGPAGKNLYNPATRVDGYYINSSCVEVAKDVCAISDYISVVPGESYVWSGISGETGSNNKRVVGYSESKTSPQVVNSVAVSGANVPYENSFTVPSGVAFIRLSFNISDGEIMVEHGTVKTNYEPYTNNATYAYVRPQGAKSITQNGTGIDVAEYATVDVSVSGGIDIPTFTVTLASDGETVVSVTCDKTFAECGDYLSNNIDSAILNTVITGGDTFNESVTNTEWTPGSKITYTSGIWADIVYTPNSLTYVVPSWLAETLTVTENGTYYPDAGAFIEVNVDVSGGGSPTLQTKTKNYTPTESQQTEAVSADSGYDGLDTVNVTVGAISSSYVGSGITRRSSSDLTVSGDTVSAPAGYYESSASKSVASGTEGTPTATKGTVSNHAVTVTPSVTNTAGYISGGTKTGTGVSVSASELVSGSETKNANGTYDVTNLASLVVAVPIVTYYTGSSAPSSSLGSNGDIYLQTS